MKSFLGKLALVLLSLCLTLVLLEIALRVFLPPDANGKIQLGDKLIFVDVYEHQLANIQASLAAYQNPANPVRVIYDAEIGWTLAPDFGWSPLYATNAWGLRGNVTQALAPREDVLRIAVFGDSFTHSDDVRLLDTWAYLLEQNLNAAGIAAEVLNFGVGGYGMDQAYLRWRTMGQDFQPDLVLFGLQAWNMYRNQNIIRAVEDYQTTNFLPFTKPRFILAGDELRLLNQPTIPPEELVELFPNFLKSPLAPYEPYYLSPSASRAYDLFRMANIPYNNLNTLPDNSPTVRLSEAIIRAFGTEVQSAGSEFWIFHLPESNAIIRLSQNQPVPYQALLDRLSADYPLVRPESAFTTLNTHALLAEGHYKPYINHDIANYLSAVLIECIQQATCLRGKFAPTNPAIAQNYASPTWRSTFHFYADASQDSAESIIQYGSQADSASQIPLMGDWNGDGIETLGLYQQSDSTFLLKNTNEGGFADLVFSYPLPETGAFFPLAGDWDGDGIDTIGLYHAQSGMFLLFAENSAESAINSFSFGASNEGTFIPLAGDWDGNAQDSIGLYLQAENIFFLKNSNAAGNADSSIGYGVAGAAWYPLAGDWDGDGIDTIGVYNSDYGQAFLYDETLSPADLIKPRFQFNVSSRPVMILGADWQANGHDSFVIYVR